MTATGVVEIEKIACLIIASKSMCISTDYSLHFPDVCCFLLGSYAEIQVAQTTLSSVSEFKDISRRVVVPVVEYFCILASRSGNGGK